MRTTNCISCGISVECQRITKKWCSQRCYTRHRNGYPKERACLECGTKFFILTQQHDAARKYCSGRCSKNANGKRIKKWIGDHPDAVKNYNKRRLEKNPGEWKEKARRERLECLSILGGACCVCGTDNPKWLHIDYKPTCRGKGGRHARHLAFVRNNKDDFRVLCANHHYELTLTGMVEGTDITQ